MRFHWRRPHDYAGERGGQRPHRGGAGRSRNLYYADLCNAGSNSCGTVYEILWANGNYSGAPITLATGFNHPTGLVVDSSGNVFVTSAQAGKLYELVAVNGVVPPSSTPVQIASATSFNYPFSLTVDSSGNLYEVGWDNELREITAASGYTTVNTLASFSGYVQGVALDAAGDAFVASNNSIYEVMAVSGSIPASPVINTVGSGFSHAAGVALDAAGNVYVSDSNHSLVKKLDFVDPPSLTFATTSIGFTSSDSPQTVAAFNDGNRTLTFTALSAPADFPLDSSGGTVCPPRPRSRRTRIAHAYRLYAAEHRLAAQREPDADQQHLECRGNAADDRAKRHRQPGAGYHHDNCLDQLQLAEQRTELDRHRDGDRYRRARRLANRHGDLYLDMRRHLLVRHHTHSGRERLPERRQCCQLERRNRNHEYGRGDRCQLPLGRVYTVTATYSGLIETFLSSDNSGQVDGNNQTTVTWAAATASASAATSLGSVSLGSSAAHTVTFTIQTAGTIGAPVVVTTGATGMDFTDVGDGGCTLHHGNSYGYNSSETCTVDVHFAPSNPGPRYGAVLLKDTSGNILATAYVYGVGTGPLVNFTPGNSHVLLRRRE